MFSYIQIKQTDATIMSNTMMLTVTVQLKISHCLATRPRIVYKQHPLPGSDINKQVNLNRNWKVSQFLVGHKNQSKEGQCFLIFK